MFAQSKKVLPSRPEIKRCPFTGQYKNRRMTAFCFGIQV
jgi:hypothetical protein